MTKRKARIDRMVHVELEYRAAEVSTSLLQGRLQADPSFLNPFQLSHRDAIHLRTNLESTYLIRLFAEFEAGLRYAWERSFCRATRPKMEDLLRSIAARRSIPHDILSRADEVRIRRNALVHEVSADVPSIGIVEARDRLCRYFHRLPLNW